MKRDVGDYVLKCLTCQQIKVEHQRPIRLFQPLSVPKWKLEHIFMDFIIKLRRICSGYNALCVIVDRLVKSEYFLPIRDTTPTINCKNCMFERLSNYIRCLKLLYQIETNDMCQHFRGVYINLQAFSITSHPQIDGQTKRTNQVLEEILRAYCLDHRVWSSQVKILSLVEFVYNNSYQMMI